MDDFVLDTTALTEARLRRLLEAGSLEDVVRIIASILREGRLRVGARFYMTPSTWNELRRTLIGNQVGLDTIQELAAWITVKAPDKLSIRIPAAVFSEYIADIRRRLYKGLRVAEYAARKAYTECRERQEECLGDIIKDIRDRYREATRKGLLDSTEDLDTILLALELKATIVTSDEGMRRMAEQLGIIHIDPIDFITSLKRIIRSMTRGTQPT
ncbi:MAG: RNA ligase partner protein [Desulfurococcales archaeon]|nr:RNA ligase partner protein [Desulfurococcales archaeon]